MSPSSLHSVHTTRALHLRAFLSHAHTSEIIVAILICLHVSAHDAGAQEFRTLSEKPLVTQRIDPTTNETEIRVTLNTNSYKAEALKIIVGGFQGTLYSPGPKARFQSGLVLGYASHIYDGRTLTGTQRMKLTFFSNRKDGFKDQPTYSIIVDGQVIKDGMAEQPEQLTAKGEYKQKIVVTVQTELFFRIARSKKVEIKLGPKTYKLEGFQQKSMAALAITIEPRDK